MSREERTDWRDRPLSYWQELWGVPALRAFRTVDSTNDVAREMAESGAAAGSVVLAQEQTSGRGRRGRRWEAPPDSSLLLSMVLRPRSQAAAPVLSLRLGMAAARAVDRVTGLPVTVKWPNDLLVDGTKVAGILCEGSYEGGELRYLIAGLGVNLRQRESDWPPHLAGAATSLAVETGRPVDDGQLAGRVVAEWLDAVKVRSPGLEAGEIQRFGALDALRGLPVIVDGRPAGTAAGVTAAGELIVVQDGVESRVRSGTVRAVRNHSGEHP